MQKETPGAVSQDADVQAIDQLRELNGRIRAELARVIIGQDKVIEQLLTCIFARGHALLMGVPGLAKTLLVHSLADLMSMSFKPHPVHAGPDAQRHHRHGNPAGNGNSGPARLRVRERADLRQHRAGG
ncbi:MAG: hypothetical protein WDN28_01625 [Chthoniobacter sp.]